MNFEKNQDVKRKNAYLTELRRHHMSDFGRARMYMLDVLEWAMDTNQSDEIVNACADAAYSVDELESKLRQGAIANA